MDADRPREPRVGGLLARGLRKEYPAPGGPLVVLDDVSLELGRGETLAILGPSGSGKSTLLNILGGLEPPSGGSVTLEGTDPYRLSEPQQAKFRNESVGFVFQEHYLLPQLTLLENVLLPTLMRADRSSAGYLERARALLERVGLGARLAHFPSELSGGERQRGAVARALVGRPALLLADEPTGNLDRRAAAEVGEMLLALGREEGSILIVVTHSVELARGFSRKVRLESGRLEVESRKPEVGSRNLKEPDLTPLLDPKATALMVIDVQERFRPVIPEFASMVAGCVRLVRTFRILGLPIFVTEQYPRGLGSTVGEIREALGEGKIPEKTVFSSFGCTGIPEALQAAGVRSVLIAGIETHVCVHQTVHDLLAAGYTVEVAADAVQSRHAGDREIALQRMERSGAVLTATEMAAFELLRDAKHPKFREVQALYK